MNNKFTEELGAWLQTPEDSRDYKRGAEMLLQLNGNVIMYRNLMLSPERKKEHITYQLQKYYNFRVKELTHAQVEEMSAEADKVMKRYGLETENPDKAFKAGKRIDHDKLPAEIQQLYVDNLDILHRMRDVRTRLRIISEQAGDGKVCPDSDRYPYVKEIVELDKRYRDNWHRYDTWDVVKEESTMAVDSREQSKRCQRLVNLNKGRYAKHPSEELAAQIREWYGQITEPTKKLTDELEALGIL